MALAAWIDAQHGLAYSASVVKPACLPRPPVPRASSVPFVFLPLFPRDQVLAQRAKEKERVECTFRPSLNPVTQSMGQAAPLDELVNNLRGRRVRERAQARIR